MSSTIAGYLLLACLIVGPWLLGSYYGYYRWPVLALSLCTFLFGLKAFSFRCTKDIPLIIPIIGLIAQGCWMLYNTWGTFQHELWWILSRDDQPYPSLPGAPDFSEAWDRCSLIFPCLTLIWVTRHLCRANPQFLKHTLQVIFYSGALLALLGLVQKFTGATGSYWAERFTFPNRQLFFATFRSPGIATAYLNICLALGLSVITIQQRRLAKFTTLIINPLCICLLITALISAGSKAGMLLAILSILAWAIINRRSIYDRVDSITISLFKGRKFERNITFTCLLAILAFFTLSFSESAFQRWESAHEKDFSTWHTRTRAYTIQMDMINNDDWGAMGYGPGSFLPLFHFYSQNSVEPVDGIWVYAHNDFLQTAIEWGWLGFSFFTIIVGGALFFLLRTLSTQRKTYSRNTVILLRGCLIAMLITLLHACVDFPLQIESIAITFSVLTGIAWGYSKPPS